MIDGIDKPEYIFDTLIYFERRSAEFAWQIIFSKTGIAEYIEYKNAEGKITKKGEIPAGLYTKLSDFIISQCFLDYANVYSEYEGNPLYGVAITVNTGSLQKTVGSLGDGEGEPIGFWAISKLMLYIDDQIKWEAVKE